MDLEATVRSLADREAIKQAVYLYCRGLDRKDRAAVEAAYWPDAVDHHLRYIGRRDEYIDYAFQFLDSVRSQHLVGNIIIVFGGDNFADVESYYVAYHEMGESGMREDFTVHGRYLDRFEKRGEDWRIVSRTLTCDLYSARPTTSDWVSGPYANNPALGAHHPDDLLYKVFSK